MFHRHGSPDSRLDFLSTVKLFEGLPRKALEKLDHHLDEVDVPAGHRLTHEGDRAFETFIVVEGQAKVMVNDEVIGSVGPGELVGEVAVLNHRERTATVVAETPMRLLVLNSREIDWLLNDNTLSERVRAELARHLAGPSA